jgi:hypothetical protein
MNLAGTQVESDRQSDKEPMARKAGNLPRLQKSIKNARDHESISSALKLFTAGYGQNDKPKTDQRVNSPCAELSLFLLPTYLLSQSLSYQDFRC